MTVLHYIHHAAFSLNDGKTTLLFDPYLENNPEGLSSGDLKADYIFISHFHGDHVGEAYAIAKRTEALIITTAEIANDAKAHGLNAHAMHIGGSHEFPLAKSNSPWPSMAAALQAATPAASSSTLTAASFILPVTQGFCGYGTHRQTQCHRLRLPPHWR